MPVSGLIGIYMVVIGIRLLSLRKKVRRYLGIIGERYGRCRRNCTTERRRRWETRRKRRGGGGII